MSMTPAEFVHKWRNTQLTERSASQQHFLDLCDLVGHPKPAAVDQTGAEFTFERGAAKKGDGFIATGQGWADVWKKGCFAWEYKARHKDLNKAYAQLQQYREDLESPPLLVVSDMDRIIVHTNFTATPVEVHEIRLGDIGEPESLEKLRALFFDPEKLRPGTTSVHITSKAAAQLAELAQSLRGRGIEPQAAARFLDRIVFCLFAEDIALLPEGLFTRLLARTHTDPAKFARYCGQLFQAMAEGGDFNFEDIRHFNGNLFDDCAVLEPTVAELHTLHAVAQLDWSAIDPSIFGTLFERGMDPSKRSQLGAHYTSREDIETLIEPVVMLPLRREWAQTRTGVEWLLATGRKPGDDVLVEAARELQAVEPPESRTLKPPQAKKALGEASLIVRHFHERLAHVKVLDPACGSGNFLYVTLQKLKDLEKAMIVYAQNRLGESFFPLVGPWQLHGIELNPYAYDLAQMTVWIGYLQWTRANGFGITQTPVLRTMTGNFQNRDAILDLSDPENPQEPEWPQVDYVVGNPPFLHSSKLIRELGETYRANLFRLYKGRVPGFADLCCYWFEKARAHIAAAKCRRAGLLATQGIRGGASREVLNRIKESGGIFWAMSDRGWILDGANVHVSMVAFDDGMETTRTLDGNSVSTINANLTAAADTTKAVPLRANADLCVYGSQQKAPFDIEESFAIQFLSEPNPHARPNSDVVFPSLNAAQLMQGIPRKWVVDYGTEKDIATVSRYEAPFAYVHRVIKPLRENHREKGQASYWWLHARPSPRYRDSRKQFSRILLTPCVSKHRAFVFVGSEILADHATAAFARSDDYFFGILHSRLHEVWSLAQGTQLREKESGFRYTPTTCFETFPFPWSPGKEPVGDPLALAIAAAAKELNELRENWLNPPGWVKTEVLEFPGTVGGPWDSYIERDAAGNVQAETVNVPGGETVRIGTVKYPRIVPKDDASAKLLAKRTLTNLYNERPTWLANAHHKLDEAVCAAYTATTGGIWFPDMPEAAILEQLLALNLARHDAENR